MATKKKNWLEELQNIATQTVGPVQTNPATADDIVNQSAVQKVNQITELAGKMYPEDMNSRFDFWKSRLDVGQLPQGGKQAYWSTYQTMHPEGIDGATRDFVTTTRKELDYIPGMAEKEFFLRERIAQTPDWAKKQLEPILAEVSTTVANANYNKAQQVYASDLQTRVNAFLSNQQLDPDVAIDDHVNDMLKLEQMNLMEMASVMNGRVGIMKDGRSFVPAFGMTDSEQIVKDAAIAPSIEEQTVVQELARLPIKTAVADNVTSSRMKIKGQEETAKNIAQQYLRTGKYDMYSWDKAFSMMPDVPLQTKLATGLKGEVEARRISTPQDVARSVFAALSTYGAKEEPATPPEPQEYKWEWKDTATIREAMVAYYGEEKTNKEIQLAIARQKEVDISKEVYLPDYENRTNTPISVIRDKELEQELAGYNTKTNTIHIGTKFPSFLTASEKEKTDSELKYLPTTSLVLHETLHPAQIRAGISVQEMKENKPRYELPKEYPGGKGNALEDYTFRTGLDYYLHPVELPAYTAQFKAEYYAETKNTINSQSSNQDIFKFWEWANKRFDSPLTNYFNFLYKNQDKFENTEQRDRYLRLMFELPKQVAVTKVDTKTRMA